MKFFFLISMLVCGLMAQAQPLTVTASAMRKFSKEIKAEIAKDADFRNKLGILFASADQAADLEQRLRTAERDSATFAALLDAAYLIRNSPDAFGLWLRELGISGKDASVLSDVALYRFTNRQKTDLRFPAGFAYGIRKFVSDIGFGYCIVRLQKSGEIQIQHFSDNHLVMSSVSGNLKGNLVLTEDVRHMYHYFFLDGVLGSVLGDKFALIYYPADLSGKIPDKPEPVFADITMTDVLLANGFTEAQTKEILQTKLKNIPSPVNVGIPPSFPGGDAAFNKFLAENLRYPEEARRKGIEGTVMIKMVVSETGKIQHVEAMKNKLQYGLNEEAVRLAESMPDWIPGKLRDVPVSAVYRFPVRFSLD